ncbi:hypothetical protein [Streptomyces sp. NPDC051162]|uniref:hypothetical protein n=1 Tax=Streptomyces sp. NPDC051162 TaxID=3154747 RepID=UPI0034215D75
MNPVEPAYGPADAVDSWLHEALGDAPGHGSAYGAARSAIFDAVRADRGGPVACRLRTLTNHTDTAVRLVVLRLLTELSQGDRPWPAAADAAFIRLRDRDEKVRRCAAWLLAAADHRRATEELGATPAHLPPTARLALAEALFEPSDQARIAGLLPLAERLRQDHDPAVRLRAALGVLRHGLAENRAPWESAVLADLDAGGERLGGPGGLIAWRPGTLWGLAARAHGEEAACYAWIGRLSTSRTPVRRRAAIDMAEVALRHWRAAPASVAASLRPMLADTAPELRAAATAVIGASLEAARCCADELAGLLGDPRAGEAAVPALARTGDARAMDGLCALVASGAAAREVGEAVEGLAVAGVHLEPLVAAAVDALDRHDKRCSHDPVRCAAPPAVAVLRACGAASAPAVAELMRQLDECLDAASSHHWLRTQLLLALGDIGPGAAPAVPLLERVIARETDTWAADHASMTVLRLTGDRGRAERCFEDAVGQPRRRAFAASLLEWLAGHGGLSPRQSAHLRELTDRPRRLHPRLLGALWKHSGTAAARVLLDTLPRYLDDDAYGAYACSVLTDMGREAAAALPALRAVAERRTRLPLYLGDFDRETRADECLAAAARDAHAHITSLTDPAG